DLYARSGRATESGFLTPAEQDIVRKTPGVARAQFQRQQNLLLSADKPPVALLARSMVGGDPGGQLPMVAGGKATRADLPAVWVSEAMVDSYGFRLGAEVKLPFAGRLQDFVVAGVWRDFVRQSGAVVIDLDTYRRLSGDTLVTEFSVWLAPGFSAGNVSQALREGLNAGTGIDILQPGEIRRISLTAFDRTFAVTYAMEAVAVLIGLAGVAASFGALALARRREFGMLRHIGMTRGQVGGMLAAEGAMVSALGVGTGLLLGGGISYVLIRVINRQSFHWSMDINVPVASLAVFCVAMVGLAAAVSVLAGRRAMRTEVVRAVREDW
ncbi:MAG: ABC transporter permease, partial [Rhodocyclaceae bacterium]